MLPYRHVVIGVGVAAFGITVVFWRGPPLHVGMVSSRAMIAASVPAVVKRRPLFVGHVLRLRIVWWPRARHFPARPRPRWSWPRRGTSSVGPRSRPSRPGGLPPGGAAGFREVTEKRFEAIGAHCAGEGWSPRHATAVVRAFPATSADSSNGASAATSAAGAGTEVACAFPGAAFAGALSAGNVQPHRLAANLGALEPPKCSFSILLPVEVDEGVALRIPCFLVDDDAGAGDLSDLRELSSQILIGSVEREAANKELSDRLSSTSSASASPIAVTSIASAPSGVAIPSPTVHAAGAAALGVAAATITVAVVIAIAMARTVISPTMWAPCRAPSIASATGSRAAPASAAPSANAARGALHLDVDGPAEKIEAVKRTDDLACLARVLQLHKCKPFGPPGLLVHRDGEFIHAEAMLLEQIAQVAVSGLEREAPEKERAGGGAAAAADSPIAA
mmetsp:Transcript_37965/g.104380  ORF Transcript_37965/g.104380 Transcript_37965/m.104380 type:complete len:449 (+) Transcript_37965:246-1592(+)